MEPTPGGKTTRCRSMSTCRRCGAERPSWLGTPHKCLGDANLAWLHYHQMTAHTALAWRRGILERIESSSSNGVNGTAGVETPLAG